MSQRTILTFYPSENLFIFSSHFQWKIDEKPFRNRYFLRLRFWTYFRQNFAQYWEGFGQGLASIGSHFGRLGPSWTASWVPLGAARRVLGLLWTTKSQVSSISDRFWSIFHHFWTPIWPKSEHFSIYVGIHLDIYLITFCQGPAVRAQRLNLT